LTEATCNLPGLIRQVVTTEFASAVQVTSNCQLRLKQCTQSIILQQV